MSYTTLASKETIEKVIQAAEARNISVQFVETKEEALEALKKLIPEGASVMTGSSLTLQDIGFVDLLTSGQHPWKNLKDAIVNEKDKVRQTQLRKEAILADFFISSVHAITQDGQTLTASGSGSQIPSYAYSSNNVIWVAGTHKIVPTLESGLQRIREHSFLLEDKRMKDIGYPGSNIGKILIFEKEISPTRKIHLILINEVLGF